ncbi:uncharacterized protein K452DRAFT_230851 [Aplosporella prunicola CBS 121167]|uniref:Uncharacterized protein n=1 Tax=Aplosporella prunicola CBS 121167 TaxID=1176127 RepID=A0A6A6BBD7_9PEZI|nr:uncharacterized protein K452DRAFT_230851 [Aplosporella prunicola CBS 121167]KAF2140227.1 hypothetical protein K452DRAFT_230851 [Aplosporella prunicola CBS 121167]
MSAMVDSYAPYGRLPHRKPLPHTGGGGVLQPLTQIVPDEQRIHSRSRTSSSSAFPVASPQSNTFTYTTQPYSPAMTPYNQTTTRRTLSNATTSTSSTSTSAGAGTSARRNSDLRRSSSGRSSNAPSSYVALMRRQKATVWCDRAQYEDPRLLAQQRAAKMRAAMEVVGGVQASRTSTSSSGVAAGVRSKIRHHGAPKASLYTPANLTGSGVPMRLSASEVDEGDSDNDSGLNNFNHHRSGSGRSSMNSGRRVHSYIAPQGARFSISGTPPSGQGNSPTDHMEETPVPGDYAVRKPSMSSDYFPRHRGTGLSSHSTSSGERENSFGNIGQMPQVEYRQYEEKHTADELRRRGSVDDRTMTMSGAVRLFVANPDMDN